MVGFELGLMFSGKMIVCGDSYILIYGVFGVFVFGIGMSEVEYVFFI